MTSPHADHSPVSTYWQVEPVHDAVIDARLADLQGTLARATATSPDGAATNPARQHGGVIRDLRHRVGRAVTSVGRAIEGPPDCPDPATRGMA